MTRSDVAAAVLLVAAGGAGTLGVRGFRVMKRESMRWEYESAWLLGHATALLAFALFVTACLCTAAVLWARGGRGKVP